MRRKGEIAIKILEWIGAAGATTADLFETILSSPYGSSLGTLTRRLDHIQRKRAAKEFGREQEQKFYNYLYRLRKDGLIEKNHRRWSLTRKGEAEIKVSKADRIRFLFGKQYERIADDVLKIVAFDIPEQHRRKRDWLRSMLVHLGFTKLQKSLWIGKAKLPEEFINDLDNLELLSFVEIFAITKTGSIRHLT